jgi:hypothetical protein
MRRQYAHARATVGAEFFRTSQLRSSDLDDAEGHSNKRTGIREITKQAARHARSAAALRENLRRRKQAGAKEPDGTRPKPGTDTPASE